MVTDRYDAPESTEKHGRIKALIDIFPCPFVGFVAIIKKLATQSCCSTYVVINVEAVLAESQTGKGAIKPPCRIKTV
jgi:hypothetical protein